MWSKPSGENGGIIPAGLPGAVAACMANYFFSSFQDVFFPPSFQPATPPGISNAKPHPLPRKKLGNSKLVWAVVGVAARRVGLGFSQVFQHFSASLRFNLRHPRDFKPTPFQTGEASKVHTYQV